MTHPMPYIDKDGLMRCAICTQPVSACACDMQDPDLEPVTYPNHFPWNSVGTADIHQLGYNAICQHLADLTRILDQMKDSRS